MQNLPKRLLARLLIGITNLLPEPGPKSEVILAAQKPAKESSGFQWPRRNPPLGYQITKVHLSRIFRLETGGYADEPSEKGHEIRVTAGFPPTALRSYEHGFGQTRVLRAERSASVYVNLMKYGRMSSFDRFTTQIVNTIKAIPTILIYSRKKSAILEQAARLNAVPRPCEQSIVARTSILSDDPKKTIFTLSANCTDGEKDEFVTLRDIFMPVVDDNGVITGTRKIPSNADNAEILRSLIFMKLVTDKMRDREPVKTKELLSAVEKLPLDNNSRINDYFTYTP